MSQRCLIAVVMAMPMRTRPSVSVGAHMSSTHALRRHRAPTESADVLSLQELKSCQRADLRGFCSAWEGGAKDPCVVVGGGHLCGMQPAGHEPTLVGPRRQIILYLLYRD